MNILAFRFFEKRRHEGPGAPRKIRTLDREMLVDCVDHIADELHKKGSKAPQKEAPAEAAELDECKPLATVIRYYYEGVAKLAAGGGEARIAREVERLALQAKATSEQNPLEYALAKTAREYGQSVFVMRRRYKRGLAALAKATNNK